MLIDGHCAVGIGGCYEPVNEDVSAELATVAAQYAASSCASGGCDCGPPPPVTCAAGRCALAP